LEYVDPAEFELHWIGLAETSPCGRVYDRQERRKICYGVQAILKMMDWG
jgi:hypothetical protein